MISSPAPCPPNLPHIAIVVPAPDGGTTPWIVHNIGQGPNKSSRAAGERASLPVD
jgi:hypothetical protein